MRTTSSASGVVCFASAMMFSIAWTVVPDAQRREADNTTEGAPLATSAIARDAAAYYGKLVTLSAAVEKVLSKTAFVIDQQRVVRGRGVTGMGSPLLVIAPGLTSVIKPTDSLLVRGEIVKFDAASISRAAPGYTLDLPADAQATFAGSPVLMAQSVRDSQSTELAKQP